MGRGEERRRDTGMKIMVQAHRCGTIRLVIGGCYYCRILPVKRRMALARFLVALPDEQFAEEHAPRCLVLSVCCALYASNYSIS